MYSSKGLVCLHIPFHVFFFAEGNGLFVIRITNDLK